MPTWGNSCCICLTKTSKRFTSTSNFDLTLIERCFELLDIRKGKVYEACRRAVYKHKQNPQITFGKLVDSKGQHQSRHKDTLRATRKSLAELNKAKAKSFPFERLPNELLEKVSSYLTVKEILAFQAAFKRFYDFCLDFDERLWLPLVKCKHPNLYQQIRDRPAASWKAVYLLLKSTDRYVSCVQQHNEKLVQYVTSRNQALQEERDKALEESQRIAKNLASLQTVQGDSLRPEQETMFTSMVKLKLRRSENGVIQAHNVRGRPTNLLQIRSVELIQVALIQVAAP